MGVFLTGVAAGAFLLFVVCVIAMRVVFGPIRLRQYSWHKLPVLLREFAARYEAQQTLRQYDRWLAALPATNALIKKIAQ